MLPEYPLTKQVIAKSQGDFFEFACNLHSGPYIGKIDTRPLPEGNRMKQEYSREMVLDTPMRAIRGKFDTNRLEVNATPFIIYEKFFETAKEFAAQQNGLINLIVGTNPSD